MTADSDRADVRSPNREGQGDACRWIGRDGESTAGPRAGVGRALPRPCGSKDDRIDFPRCRSYEGTRWRSRTTSRSRVMVTEADGSASTRSWTSGPLAHKRRWPPGPDRTSLRGRLGEFARRSWFLSYAGVIEVLRWWARKPPMWRTSAGGGSLSGRSSGRVDSSRCSRPSSMRERTAGGIPRHPHSPPTASGPPTGFSTRRRRIGRAVHRSCSWTGSMEGSGYEGRRPRRCDLRPGPAPRTR